MDTAASYTPATRALDGKGNCRGKRKLAQLRLEDSLRDRKNSPRSQREQQQDQELPAGAALSAAGGGVIGATTLPRPATRPRPKGEQAPTLDGREAGGEFDFETPAEARRSIFTGAGWVPRLSLESSIYLLFIAIAIFTRFWDLGSRALHHDES